MIYLGFLLLLFSFLFLVIAVFGMNLSHNVSGERSQFPRVEINDDTDDWMLQKFVPSSDIMPIQTSPNGPTVYISRIPVSVTECMINDQAGEKSNLLSPDISSISYNSDGKVLNATTWLGRTYPPLTPPLNGSDPTIPHSILANPIASQVAYSVYTIKQQNRTLAEAVAEHKRITQNNLSSYHIFNNLTGYIGTEVNPIYQLAYSYTGNARDICVKCMGVDFLSMMNNKLYLISYSGDVEKIAKLIPIVEEMIDSTETYNNPLANFELQYPSDWNNLFTIGNETASTTSRIYNNPLANFELQYPSDWNNLFTIGNETVSMTLFQPAAETVSPFLGGVALAIMVNQSKDLQTSDLSNRTAIVPTIETANQPQTITLAGKQVQVLNHTFLMNGGMEIAMLDVTLKEDGKFYTIRYSGERSKFLNYFDTFMEIIHSLKIVELKGSVKNQTLSNINSDFSIYENTTHRIRFSYPSNWTLSEQSTDPMNTRLSFEPGVPLVAYLHLDLGTNLTDFLKDRERFLSESYPGYKRINFTETTILGKDAYVLTYRFPLDIPPYPVVSVREYGIMDYEDKLVLFEFYIPSTRSIAIANNLLREQAVIESLELNIDEVEHKGDFIRMKYPYNWAKVENAVPSGYNETDIIYSAVFFSPIEGPFYYAKNYRIDFDYDYAYKKQGTYFPYAVLYSSDLAHPNWTKLVHEFSMDGGAIYRILQNETIKDRGVVEEEKGYVLWNIDLDSLNLPNQFYMTLGEQDFFVKDGKDCSIEDSSSIVGSPPPEYLLTLSPPFAEGMRPDEVKNIKVDVKTNSTLPFTLTFSAVKQGLELGFDPNNITGSPSGVTTVNLRIKVLPNVTLNEPLSFPVYSNIRLTPTFNPTNANSTIVTKVSDFTMTVLPPKGWHEILEEGWSKFGSVLSGIGALVVTLLTIAGVAGGWFASRYRRQQRK